VFPVRFFRVPAFCLACLAFMASCEKKQLQRTDFVLGTVCSVRFSSGVPLGVFDAVFGCLYELDDILSANKEGSDLDAVNKNAGVAPVAVRQELIDVLSRALFFARVSGGADGRAAFDPTIGPLVKLWGIGGESPRVPDPDEMRAALALVDWREVEVDGNVVFLRKVGMSLDLGAIAKGYAADEAARIIRSFGIESAVVDLGGNIFALGGKPDGGPYKIGIQNPLLGRGAYSGFVEARNQTLVTSGSYERFFERDGVRYHHILSTETGYPVENGLLSATIVAGSSIDADALSTTVYALGYEKGSALLRAFPDVEAIFIFADGSTRTTAGARYTDAH
jgi:thiamine biosynthesis lipoprotein